MSEQIEIIPAIVKYWAQNKPDDEIFTFVNKHGRHSVYTPRDVCTLAGKYAARIRGFGFSEGDVIANGLPNSPERLITDLGIILAGCLPVNCQILERDGAGFWNTARLAGCRAVVISTRPTDIAFQLFSALLPQNVPPSGCVDVTVPAVESLRKVVTVTRDPNDESGSLLSSLQNSTEEEFYADPRPEDLAVLFATSGSSGYCKLVPRSHQQILRCGRNFQAAKNMKYFSDRPFGWMGGFPFDYLAHCSSRILQDMLTDEHAVKSFDLWTVISREKCNGAAILPLSVLELLEEFKDKTPEFKLNFLVTGGQPLRKNLAGAIGVLADALVVSYGSTEAAMVCVGLVTSAAQVKDYYSGAPSKSTELKVVDEEGNVLKAGEEGEILIKSPLVMTGYYGQQNNNNIFTPDGWLKTGDRGYLDASGHLYCFGRAGDAIFRGAAVIYTSWPEGILSKLPGVEDAIVVGLSDETGSQNLYGCVRRTADSSVSEESLLEAYHATFVETSRREKFTPEITRLFFFDRFPETHTGKINKRELIKQIEQMLQS